MKTGPVQTDYKKMPDEELVHRYRHRHEHQALLPLFDRYGHLVLGICLSYMKEPPKAANATHAIFIRLVDDLKKYDEYAFKPWLYSYVNHYCIAQGYASSAFTDDNIQARFSQRFTIDTATQAKALEKALTMLSAEQRKCIELFYLSRMSHKDIAASVGLSLQQVKDNLISARRYLKEQVEKIAA